MYKPSTVTIQLGGGKRVFMTSLPNLQNSLRRLIKLQRAILVSYMFNRTNNRIIIREHLIPPISNNIDHISLN